MMDNLKALDPPIIVSMTRQVLKSHYERQQRQLKNLLDGFDEINWDGLEAQWLAFSQTYPPKEAIALFTSFVSGILDGGDGPIPPNYVPAIKT